MKAYELLADPANWTKGSYALDAEGHHVTTDDPSAVCFCTVGAIFRCYGHNDNNAYAKVQEACGGNIAAWNDRPYRTHAEVIDLLRQLDV